MIIRLRTKITLIFVLTALVVVFIFSSINKFQTSFLIEGIILLVISLILGLIISRYITKPISQIITSLKEIGSGNFNKLLEVDSKDEISELAKAINELTQKIKSHTIELEKLAAVRSQFLSNVSHELRTPIFSIQAFIETLLDGAVDDPEVNRAYLTRAHNQLERLNILLNDLIDISRIESGEMKLSYRNFNLLKLLNSVVENSAMAAESKKIKVELHYTLPQALQVNADSERIVQVLNNLLDNAIKYNNEGTRVLVYCNLEPGQVRIFVSDNGTGIAKEHQERIFERFYRVNKERSRELGGTGLGLAIVKHIIEAHGSKIEIESTPGLGTKFHFALKTVQK